MNIPSTRISSAYTRIGAGIVGIVLALVVIVSLAGTSHAAEANASAQPSGVREGVIDVVASLQRSVERCGQDILDETSLEFARRTDTAAEERRLEAINTQSQQSGGTSSAKKAAGDTSSDKKASSTSKNTTSDSSSSSASSESSSKKKTSSKKSSSKRKNTLLINGQYVRFKQGSPADMTAPAGVASTWVGNGDVNDGENTYFIGHNPGVFECVMDLEVGDKVAVWDRSGKKRTYYVFDVLVLPNATNYFHYESRIAPSGETITLQTCCNDEKNVRCVMAK